jgi:hypothetical protein
MMLTYIVVDGRCVAMAVPQSDACRAGHLGEQIS